MVQFGKKAAVLTAAGVLAAMSVTGCSGSIDTDAVVATVGDEDITLGVANFYARMMQGQYETYYASMMGTTAEEMWVQDAGADERFGDGHHALNAGLHQKIVGIKFGDIAQHAEHRAIHAGVALHLHAVLAQ